MTRSGAGARPRSLRSRLLLMLLLSLTAGLAAIGLGVFMSAQDEIDELFDAQLAQAARTLLELPLAPGGEHFETPAAAIHPYEHKLAYVLRSRIGGVVQRSPFADLSGVPAECTGFADRTIGGQHWRVACFASPARALHVVVGQRRDIREELVFNITMSQFVPFLLALPLFAALAWIVVGRGLSPLDTLSGEFARRSPHDLRPLATDSTPAEVRPMVDALNRLFARVETTLEHERRFTADAAHELRTPLAALRTQAEVARNALPTGEAQRALDKVVTGVERATRLVEQLLALARVDDAESVGKQSVALHSLAREVIGAVAEQAAARRVDVSLVGETSAIVEGHAGLLSILLRNLVDNAIRHAGAGGEVTVKVEPGAIEVTDTGPGIAPEERARVMQRFHRGEGAKSIGSGLGLSIVARIAELHEASVRLLDGDDGKGLRVNVAFPAPGG